MQKKSAGKLASNKWVCQLVTSELEHFFHKNVLYD